MDEERRSKLREYQREYRAKNAERLAERDRAYRQTETAKASSRDRKLRYRERNRDRVLVLERELQKKKRLEDPEKARRLTNEAHARGRLRDKNVNLYQALLDRSDAFWSKVAIRSEDECWDWTSYGRKHNGKPIYGEFRVTTYKSAVASRCAYELKNGPIPDGMIVCHRCDNPPCCNPKHLFLGTHADNVADKVSKGRNHLGRMSKLSADDILNIKNDISPVKAIAKIYGLSTAYIYSIRAGTDAPFNTRTVASDVLAQKKIK